MKLTVNFQPKEFVVSDAEIALAKRFYNNEKEGQRGEYLHDAESELAGKSSLFFDADVLSEIEFYTLSAIGRATVRAIELNDGKTPQDLTIENLTI